MMTGWRDTTLETETKTVEICEFCGKPLPVEHLNAKRVPRPMTVILPCPCPEATEARKKAAEEAEAARLTEALEERVRIAGVPVIYRTVPRIDRYRADLDSGNWIYFTGAVGSGKTTSAAIALKDWIASNAIRYDEGRYFSFPVARWLSAKDTLKTAYDNDLSMDEVIGGARLVVLDDLGKGKPTEWFVEQLFELIDHLYSDGRTVIVTSQYPLSKLAQKLSKGDPDTADAIISRLRHKCSVYDMGSKDRRTK